MTLREQFEKETGESPHLLNLNEGELCKPAYVIWLEQQIPIREQAAQEDIEFRNKLTDLVCDKLLNHNPAGRFAGKKMDECADLIKKGRQLTSPKQVTDGEIETVADRRYEPQDYPDRESVAFVEGAKWMREQIGGKL